MRCFLPVAFLTREAKRVKSAISYMPIVSCELPYEGAKEMLLVDEVDNKEFLTGLFHAMYDDLQFMPLSFCKRKNLTPILHMQQNTLTKDHYNPIVT